MSMDNYEEHRVEIKRDRMGPSVFYGDKARGAGIVFHLCVNEVLGNEAEGYKGEDMSVIRDRCPVPPRSPRVDRATRMHPLGVGVMGFEEDREAVVQFNLYASEDRCGMDGYGESKTYMGVLSVNNIDKFKPHMSGMVRDAIKKMLCQAVDEMSDGAMCKMFQHAAMIENKAKLSHWKGVGEILHEP